MIYKDRDPIFGLVTMRDNSRQITSPRMNNPLDQCPRELTINSSETAT